MYRQSRDGQRRDLDTRARRGGRNPLAWTTIILAVAAAGAAFAAGDETPTSLALSPGAVAGEPKVSIQDRGPRHLTLEVDLPSVDVGAAEVAGRTFTTLAIPGGEVTGEPGRAGVPVYSRLVAVPAGASARVTLTGQDLVPLPAGKLAPVQPETQPGLTTAPAYDADWYAAAARTQVSVTAGEPAVAGGVRLVPVTFSPVSWDPASGELAVARRLTVEVEFSAAAGGAPARPVAESFARMFEGAVLGFDRGAGVAEGPGSHLYVCPDNAAVVSALQPLLDWRRRQGYNTVLATTAQAGTTATAIKSFIQAAYNTYDPPLEFVTLVGDVSGSVAVPCWQETLSGYHGEGDLDYALLEGGDVLVDVHVGRLSVDSASQLVTVVDKIVDYESDPDLSETNWFTTAGLTGDPSSSGYSCIWVNQFVKESLHDLGYTRVDTIWSGNFVNQMVATVNQGETVFTYRGYLNMSGMSTSHIMALSNGRQLPYAVIMTCDTGSYGDPLCRSEAFLRAPNGGGIGAVGTATWGTHTRYNNCIFLGTTHGLLNTGEYRLGPSLTWGRLNLYLNYIVNEPTQVRIWSHWNNLMGDPATRMWTGVPRTLAVTHPGQLNAQANALPVAVTSGGLPLAGALVAAYQAGTVRATAYTDAAGEVVLPIDAAIDGALQLTVTGDNLRPYLATVAIGAVTSSLDLAAFTADEAAGNGDDVPNPGESLLLDVQLANHGTVALPGVTAVLASPVPWAHVTTASRSFGAIAGGGAAWSQGAYGLDLDADAPGGREVPLRLEATSGGQTWTSLVAVTVTGPRLTVNRATYAGPGGTMDPGESGAVRLDVVNAGNQNTTGVTGTLSCSSPWVTITDATGGWGSIPVGSAAAQSDPFGVSVGAECYPGHLANFTVALQFAEGGTGVVEFQQVVGTADVGDPTGPDAYGYYVFDDQDPDGNAPQGGWFDIVAIGQNAGVVDNGSYGDDTREVALPFPFTMYGETFTTASICSNGWLALGHTYQRLYRNWHLPSAGGPGHMICAFWDDLAQGTVYTYHDAANHRFIVQWEGWRTADGWSYTGNCTFQIILYDPAHHATATGDGPIELRYESVTVEGDETTYFTTGLQNGPRTTGVTYAYGNNYAGGAAALGPGRALRIVPVVPQVQGQLSGTVTNASHGGSPIPGATVTVVGSGRQLLSDVQGQFAGGVPVGTWDVAVWHASCAPDTVRDVVIATDAPAVVNFSLDDVRGPAFAGTTQLSDTVDTAGPYAVETTITDLSGVAARHLYYTSSATGGPHEVELTVVDADAGVVRGEIPGQPLGSRVQYWLTAVDPVGNASQEPAGAPWPCFVFQVSQPVVAVSDAMETTGGWLVNVGGQDTATLGLWTRVDPNTVLSGSGGYVVSPGDDHTPAPGTMCWVTGQDAEGASQGGEDVDGGATTLYSPVYDLSAHSAVTASYWRWYTNDTGNAPGQDTWRVQVTDDGANWVDLEATMESQREWTQRSFALGDVVDLTATVRLRFIAEDAGAGSVVEALVDDLTLTATAAIADAADPTVTLTYPNGGEVLAAGDELTVTWDASDDTGVVEARVYLDAGGQELLVATGALPGACTFVPGDVLGGLGETAARVRVVVLDAAQRQASDASDGDVIFTTTTGAPELPGGRVALAQNHPNPFNPRTEIRFALPRAQVVSLCVYDVRGQLVRTLEQGARPAGAFTAVWTGEDDRGDQVSSGLYFYRLTTEDGAQTRKMLLLK